MGNRSVCQIVSVGLALCLICAAPGHSQSMAVAERPGGVSSIRVTVHVSDVPLVTAIEAIAREAGLRTFLDDKVLAVQRKVSVHARNEPVGDVLAKALAGTGMQAKVSGGQVAVFSEAASAPAAQGSISGKVVDGNTRQGLRGATITLVGTNARGVSPGTTSGDDGTFRIVNVTPGSYTVQVRLLGYVKGAKTVTVMDGQTLAVEVALEPSVNALDQIIVTGTVVETAQREVSAAMTVITAKDIEARGITRIDQLFRGDVPGLFAQNQGSNSLLDEVVMFSRGATSYTSSGSAGTLYGTNPIKTYVDGVELADSKYLSQIDPSSIERIEIVTGPQASTIYGSNAINGVMQIFTKRTSGSSRPRLTASFLSGLVQNNFRPTFAPQHDYTAQVDGAEGHWSYNVGGSWNYVGPWTPAKQTSRLSGFGGARVRHGMVTADVTLRLATTQNRQGGTVSQLISAYREMGWYPPHYAEGVATPNTQTLIGQTMGFSFGIAPVSWWSHEVVVGRDQSNTETRKRTQVFGTPNDTLLSLQQNTLDRRSLRTASTVQIPLADVGRGVVTVGADAWQTLQTSLSVSPPSLTGTLTGTPTVTRQPGHNGGGFLQAQIGVKDQLFLTYGLRAEWNPNYGADAVPNLAPRYGATYTRDLGVVTTKFRVSYGRSTRPPGVGQSAARTASDVLGASYAATFLTPYYGVFDYYMANPDLAPEYQQGGEGGMELYWGQRGSLIVTRYNQTVDGLIVGVAGADSVRSLMPNPGGAVPSSRDDEGYAYYRQVQLLNVGSIRNQGWELQGSVNTGPFTTRATYSWTKSRVIAMNPRYRSVLTGSQYQEGASFLYLPEHTWALGVTYARARTTMAINLTGTGELRSSQNPEYFERWNTIIRLPENRVRINVPFYPQLNAGYVLADVKLTHRINRRLESLLEVRNLADTYRNDFNAQYASLGRQTKLGFRMRLPN